MFLLPNRFRFFSSFNTFSESLQRLFRYAKIDIFRPVQAFFCQTDLFFTKRCTVRSGSILFVGAAKGNMGTHNNQGRPPGFSFGSFEGIENCIDIISVIDFQNMPVIGFETKGNVFGKGYICITFNGDFVVIVNAYQSGKAQVPGKGRSF